MSIIRAHPIDKVPVSEVCQQHGLNLMVFYNWQKKVFEERAVVFDTAAGRVQLAEGDGGPPERAPGVGRGVRIILGHSLGDVPGAKGEIRPQVTRAASSPRSITCRFNT